jgi:hypothetical protein
MFLSDFEIERKGTGYALTATAVVWILLLIAAVTIPAPRKQEQYQTVQIHLSSPVPVEKPLVQKAEKKTVEKESPLPAAVHKTAPVPVKPPPVKENKSTGVSAAAPVVPHKSTASAKPVSPQPLAKSVEELMAEQSSAQAEKPVEWDENMFNDGSAVSASSDQRPQSVSEPVVKDALSGSAASAGSTAARTSSSSDTGTTASDESSLASTKNALGEIRSATYAQVSGNGVSSSASINTAEDSDGNTLIQMSDGSARVLLDPKEPSISISEKNSRLIDSSRSVTIVFKVLAAGNVPLSGIEIRPASSLPITIQSEIKTQISKWRFATDTTDGAARFEFTIVKK